MDTLVQERAETAATAGPAQPTVPPQPRTIQDTGLGSDQIEQWLVKTLFTGEASGHVVADRMRLAYTMLEPLIERLRAERQIEVRGTQGSGTAGFRYATHHLGRGCA